MRQLNALELSIDDNILIEASAGTGKTYTITTLFLKALLGLQHKTSLRPISIENILVVTFTDAATQELKSRIRTRLLEAQRCILQPSSKDALLNELLQQFYERCEVEYSDKSLQQIKLVAYHLLEQAISLIDEAAIYTIHGFCHRVLQRFAFETNSPFDVKFEMDASEYQMNALQDFWRIHINRLTSFEFSIFRKYWKTPDQLFFAVKPILYKTLTLLPVFEQRQYEQTMSEFQSNLLSLKDKWSVANFSEIIRSSGIKQNGKSYRGLTAVDKWLSNESLLSALDIEWSLWSSEKLHDITNFKKGSSIIEHSLISDIDTLVDLQQTIMAGGFKSYWLSKTKQFVEHRIHLLKIEHNVLFPDDLLNDLAQATKSTQHQDLIYNLQAQYPIAFIDEFQDTDPVQYQIFSSIYHNTQNANVILIGDPKQAIYKFRGADIHTYLLAKRSIPESHQYTLTTNWRSHPELIKAVNHCFLNRKNVFQYDEIQFIDVGAGKTEQEDLIVSNTSTAKLHFAHLVQDKEENSGFKANDGIKHLAIWCANEIKTLLLNASNDNAHIKFDNERKTIAASDIAVLVRNRDQAKQIKIALLEQGIDAVYLSRDSVFKTELAKDLYWMLVAFESPYNEKHLKTATATLFFHYSELELRSIFGEQSDSLSRWQLHTELFHQCHVLWRQGNAFAAVNKVVQFSQCYHRWFNDINVNAERLITDLRHLLELVQQSCTELAGQNKVLSWLQSQIIQANDNNNESEIAQLRLESDANLIQISTFHASKGLEYPIVFLPFVCDHKAANEAIFQDKGLAYRVDNRSAELEKAEQERIAEDIRLLYVIMTRAVYKLYVGLYNPTIGKDNKSLLIKSAIGQLLLGEDSERQADQVIDDYINDLQAKLNTSAQQTVYLEPITGRDIIDRSRALQSKAIQFNTGQVLDCRQFEAEIDQTWKIVSYSSLLNSISINDHQNQEWYAGVSDEVSVNELVESKEADKSPMTFPKGANAGSCLHWMLEQLDFTQAIALQEDVIEQGLTRFGIDADWKETVVQWLQQVINTKVTNFSLQQITANDKLVELEFYFSFQQLTPKIIGNALSMLGYSIPDTSTEKKGYDFNIKGLLKGFIDLTIHVNGKYYVLDYKSNFLGDQIADYNQSNLQQSMSDHNYHLQALIYILALHRFLKSKINDYCYEKHVGGAFYLFLRGMLEDNDCGVYHLEIKEEVINYIDNALLCNASLTNI